MLHQNPEPNLSALLANRRGVELRAQGRLSEALAAFREGLAAQSTPPELHANIGVTLSDLGRLAEARQAFETALALDSANLGVQWALYELEQIAGNREKALAHQNAVLRRQTVFTHRALREQRSVLVLMSPGDWQVNVPIDFLIDSATTTLHKFFIVSAEQAATTRIPQADVIFNAIGESEEHLERLQLASTIVRNCTIPCINEPEHVLKTNRVRLYEALRSVANVVVPETHRVSREQIESERQAFHYPLVVRPVDSQAGRDLARVDESCELSAYLDRTAAHAFYIMPFIDCTSPDGYYRKCRVIVVDGVPYPYHMAISPRWMIHYYNAPMREQAWMREEEHRFLSGFEDVFGTPLRDALVEIARILQLEYFGVDCSIDREGRLVVFEADPAMIVHAGDDPQLFEYKYSYAKRIFTAFERLLDSARARRR